MFKQKSFWVVYLIVSLLMILLINGLYNEVGNGMVVPIALIDDDKTDFSKYVVEKIKDNENLKIIETNNELKDLNNQKIEAIFKIVNGAQDNVLKGDFENLIEVTYIKGNYFVMMLTDIISGEFLDEISRVITQQYYKLGYENLKLDVKEKEITKEIYNKSGQNKENYFISVQKVNEKNSDMCYNNNVILEKMVVGIIYIFISFFILFIGLYIIKDYKTKIYERISITKLSSFLILISEYLSLVIGGIMVTLPLTILVCLKTKLSIEIIVINLLYIITVSSIVYTFMNIINDESAYILIGISSIIVIGIISGSFFSVNLEDPLIFFMAKIFPSYYAVNTYFYFNLINGFLKYTFFCVLFSYITIKIINTIKIMIK